ncbi:hypothetical protein OF83DRAFT_130018 [Amylostereum chailletii]|nr:hypothetical protein OF83DRAFT_130018 [Amylostereum chailletii]
MRYVRLTHWLVLSLPILPQRPSPFSRPRPSRVLIYSPPPASSSFNACLVQPDNLVQVERHPLLETDSPSTRPSGLWSRQLYRRVSQAVHHGPEYETASERTPHRSATCGPSRQC